MPVYSKKVMDHFTNPRNVGVIENPDGYGKVGNPVCGDLMEMYIKVKNDIITDIKFKTFGCGSAIATSSMVTELAIGKTIDEALKLTRNDVANELDGLPPQKMHCSNLAADALHAAIEDYKKRRKNKKKLEEETYQCENCGKTVKISDEKIPECCGKLMKKLPLDICLQPAHAEHTRPMEDEDACDDFRSGE